jgi:hypothetical protein
MPSRRASHNTTERAVIRPVLRHRKRLRISLTGAVESRSLFKSSIRTPAGVAQWTKRTPPDSKMVG